MPLLGHSLIMQQIRDFRMVAIEGRYGSYKTALAFRLAYELVKLGEYRHVVANLPSSLPTPTLFEMPSMADRDAWFATFTPAPP